MLLNTFRIRIVKSYIGETKHKSENAHSKHCKHNRKDREIENIELKIVLPKNIVENNFCIFGISYITFFEV